VRINTGDLVVVEDGVLVFAGRLKRFVKKAGEMISLPAIEALLGDHFADRCSDGPCLAVESAGDEAHPELVLFTTFDVELDEINRAIRTGGLSSLHWISKVVRIDELPLLGTGKIDYKALQREVARDVLATHDISAEYTKLRN
jgi:acyl-[acyl-carrier-protein]-phospholipid O-acyltransferase/long-chain-fatty-acid--[acyl-carrier-protein] ligase